MNIPFFYEDFSSQHQIVLSENNVHYIANVLRMKTNEKIVVVNGKGIKCLCKLLYVSKKNVEIQIVEVFEIEKQNPTLHLAISFTKNATRIEWMLEKITEIGIHSITPLITKRSEKIHFKKERFEKILVSAMLQSQQSFLPVLHQPTAFQDILQNEYEQKLIAYCDTDFEKNELEKIIQKDKNTFILIGPEGDFSSDEVHLCMQQNFQTISLGKNRLRTETAGLYVCTVFNSIQKF